jgi:hypothetical protein
MLKVDGKVSKGLQLDSMEGRVGCVGCALAEEKSESDITQEASATAYGSISGNRL